MKYCICVLFSLFAAVSFSQGTTSFVGIGAKLQIDSTTLSKTKAAKITEFTPDGSALTSGLKVGDLITKVNGQNATNIPLPDVIKLIAGEEGTNVTIVVSRNGSAFTYTLLRKKIARAITFKAAESTDFCNAMSILLTDAQYSFMHVVDTNSRDQNGNAPCTLKVPGVENIGTSEFLGRTLYLTFGKFATAEQANKAGEQVLADLKSCFPSYYYHPYTSGETKTIQIGTPVKDGGYTTAMMVFYSYLDSEDKLYHVELRLDDGVSKAFLPITTTAQNSDFAIAIRKVYDDVSNNFSTIKGTEHDDGDLFNTSYWYDLNITIPVAATSYIDAGSMMSSNPEQCIAQFFLGEKELSKETYTKFAQIMYDALGSEFIYSYDKPDEFMTAVIPETAEDIMLFAIKKERVGESIPVIALLNVKQPDGRYLIYLNFYKTVY